MGHIVWIIWSVIASAESRHSAAIEPAGLQTSYLFCCDMIHNAQRLHVSNNTLYCDDDHTRGYVMDKKNNK